MTTRRTPRTRRLAVVALLILISAAACSEGSRVDPNATITVSGAVTAPDGSPAAMRPVKLGTGVEESDGAFAVLTVGLSCTTGACTGNVRATETDETGAYSLTLKGSDTQSTFGEAVSVLVSTTGAPRPSEVSGPMTSVRFRVQTEAVSLPPLPLVDPGLALDVAGGVRARWATERAGPYDVAFDDGDDVPVWVATTTESSVVIDPRVLEDTAGRVVVSGSYQESIEGSDAAMQWRSPGVPYAAGAGAPPSRGRPCRFVDAAGTSVDSADGCHLTDGDLADSAVTPSICADPAGAGPCSDAVAVVVDLGTDVPAHLVVVRGCDGGCGVEVSADGTTFVPAGSASDRYGQVILGGGPIRAVKVGLGTGAGLREVSVWDAGPEQPLRSVDEETAADLAAPYGGELRGDDEGDGAPVLLVVIAVALAAAVLVAAGVVVGRRRPGGVTS